MNELEIKNNQVEVVGEANVANSAEADAMPRHDFAPVAAKITLRSLRAETEMQAISHALEQTGWNRKRAAQLLSISYRGLLYKIRQHNITKSQTKGNGGQHHDVTQNQGLAGVSKRGNMADTLTNWEAPGLAVAGGGTPGKD